MTYTTFVCLVAQLYLTLCEPMDCSPPDSSAHGIFQARILELVAIRFSRWSFHPSDLTQVSCIAGRFFTCWAIGEALITFRKGLLKWLSGKESICQCRRCGFNPWVGNHFLLQGTFLIQGSNSHLLHWQVDSLSPCHLEIKELRDTVMCIPWRRTKILSQGALLFPDSPSLVFVPFPFCD